MSSQTTTLEPDASLVTLTHATYALHALGLAIGAFGASTVIGAFVFGWPSIIAVIINYVKRGDARGTWLESHFRWQIRTFWIALAWVVVIGLAPVGDLSHRPRLAAPEGPSADAELRPVRERAVGRRGSETGAAATDSGQNP